MSGRRRNRWTPLALFLPAAAWLALATAPAGTAEEKPAVLSIQVTTLDGDEIHFGEKLAQGPVLLDFWATWCKPCAMALPEVQRLHEKYAERGLTVIGISMDGPRNIPKVRPFAKQLGLTFPNVIDEKGDVGRAFQVLGLPTSVLIAPDGQVVHTKLGYRPGEGEKLGVEIEKYLLAPADSAAAAPSES